MPDIGIDELRALREEVQGMREPDVQINGIAYVPADRIERLQEERDRLQEERDRLKAKAEELREEIRELKSQSVRAERQGPPILRSSLKVKVPAPPAAKSPAAPPLAPPQDREAPPRLEQIRQEMKEKGWLGLSRRTQGNTSSKLRILVAIETAALLLMAIILVLAVMR